MQRPLRRGPARARALVLAILVAGGIVAAAPSAPALPVVHRVFLGAYPGTHDGESRRHAVLAFERRIGRKLDVVRVYDRWNSAFPTRYERWLRGTGRRIFLSVAARRQDGSVVPWRAIANAGPGSAIQATLLRWARRIARFHVPLFFTFQHEPELARNTANGSADDFKAAWRRVVEMLRGAGATNAELVWTMTDASFAGTGSRATAWYPGDDYVDDIGADAYNWFGCRRGIQDSWKSFQELADPLRHFGLLHPGKGLMLPEWASQEDGAAPARKAAWIASADATLKDPGWGQFRAVLYWNAMDGGYPDCRFPLDSSATAQAAFAAVGADPTFGG